MVQLRDDQPPSPAGGSFHHSYAIINFHELPEDYCVCSEVLQVSPSFPAVYYKLVMNFAWTFLRTRIHTTLQRQYVGFRKIPLLRGKNCGIPNSQKFY